MSRVTLLTLLLLGCTPAVREQLHQNAIPALTEIAKVAAPELRKLAEKKGMEINEAGALCYPVSEAIESGSGVDLPLVAIMCVAPEL